MDQPSDLFGLWGISGGTITAGLAFDAQAVVAAPVWRVSLPTDLEPARAGLAHAERQLQAIDAAIPVAEHRLDRLIESLPAGRAFTPAAPAAPMPPAGPEAEFLRVLNQVQRAAPTVSFGLTEAVARGWDRAVAEAQAWQERLTSMIRPSISVETDVQGASVGRTVINRGGDVQTLCRSGSDPAWMLLHCRSVDLALATRTMMLRTIVLAVRAAVRVSAAMAVPGGMVLLVPAAWRFLSDVLSGRPVSQTRQEVADHAR